MSHQPADCVRVHIRVWSTLIQTNHVCVVSQHASGSGPPEAPNVHFDTLVGSSVWKPEICLSSSYAPCLVPEALAGLTAMMGPGLGRYHSCCARGRARAPWLTGTSGTHKARTGERLVSWASSVSDPVCMGVLDSRILIIQHMNHALFLLALCLLLYQCVSVHLNEYMWVCVETLQGANCISCCSAGSQMSLYRTPTSEIHPQEWRLHSRRLATGHPALPPSHRNLSLSS